MLISNSAHIGTANNICDTTSGGVNTAAAITMIIIAYRRIATTRARDNTPARFINTITSGNWNAIPKTFNIPIANAR